MPRNSAARRKRDGYMLPVSLRPRVRLWASEPPCAAALESGVVSASDDGVTWRQVTMLSSEMTSVYWLPTVEITQFMLQALVLPEREDLAA